MLSLTLPFSLALLSPCASFPPQSARLCFISFPLHSNLIPKLWLSEDWYHYQWERRWPGCLRFAYTATTEEESVEKCGETNFSPIGYQILLYTLRPRLSMNANCRHEQTAGVGLRLPGLGYGLISKLPSTITPSELWAVPLLLLARW